jgi:hypothetical protein
LPESHAGYLSNLAAAFEKRTEWIEYEERNRTEGGCDPGSQPQARFARGISLEEHHAGGQQSQCHDDAGQKIPPKSLSQDGYKPGMAIAIALNAAVRSKSQMCRFVRGKLKDYEGKSQLENDLQIYQAEKRVVVALLDFAEETDDKQHCSRTAEDHTDPRGKDVRYRAVHSQTLTKSVCQLQNVLH